MQERDKSKLEWRVSASYTDVESQGAATVLRSGSTTEHEAYLLASKLALTELFSEVRIQRLIPESWERWDTIEEIKR
jgi:hypothetical protein